MRTDPNAPRVCPLVGREIDAGYCLDVNLQRLGFFKPDALTEVCQEAGVTPDEVSATCSVCPHQPLTE